MSRAKPAVTASKNPANLGKKNTVSAPRSKPGNKPGPTSFRLSPVDHADFTAIALARHVSLSHLILEALQRCKHDKIWRPGIVHGAEGSVSIVPPPELVELSNVLIALAMVMEQILPRTRSIKAREHAMQIYLDAKSRIESVRKDLGC
jgi:hypothetical protein